MSSLPVAIRFLPAFMVMPVWLAIAIREDLLVSSFQKYYPLSFAMVFGSMIAGSTPIGGGVVAFPISVLVIGFTAPQGRDFSLMIQSVGMTAASFLILVTKPDLLMKYANQLAITVLCNVLGLTVGIFLTISPFVVMCIYTSSVACFALILAYVEKHLQPKQAQSTFRKSNMMDAEAIIFKDNCNINITSTSDSKPTGTQDDITAEQAIGYIIVISGFLGGLISSQVGTGADIVWYAYGSLIHNSRNGFHKIDSNDLTATSIIVMTVTSVFGSILRASTTGADAPTPEVYQALIACSCIVVLGAPLGSLFLSAKYQIRFKKLFYVLAFVQLGTFAIVSFWLEAN